MAANRKAYREQMAADRTAYRAMFDAHQKMMKASTAISRDA
jgi:hypothetical protein